MEKETLRAIIFEGGGQCFVLIMPVECMDCILKGVAAKPSEDVQPVKRRKQPLKRQQKRRAE